MTSVLNFGSSSSSNTIPSLDTNSLFSNLKLATTFIIQPSQPQSHTLLTKRCKPAELGDLLMKKIKTKSSSDSNSNQQSPTIKENSDDNLSNCLESTSMIEDINSPSTKSFCEETEVHNAHRMLEGVLIPQRSISTPLVVNTFSLRHSKSDSADNHKRVQHALEVLQKKMFMEQQASLLKEIIFKCQAAQEPLIIPPLITASDATTSPLIAGKSKKSPIQGFEDEDIIFGPVEYPLLSMAPPGFGGDFLQKELNTNAKAAAKGLFGSLAATRAETQRSDSDEMSSCDSEESDVKRRRPRKTVNAKKAETGKGKKGDKKEKGQGKEKTKTRKQK